MPFFLENTDYPFPLFLLKMAENSRFFVLKVDNRLTKREYPVNIGNMTLKINIITSTRKINMSKKRILANVINESLSRIADDTSDHMPKWIDRPTKFTLRAFKTKSVDPHKRFYGRYKARPSRLVGIMQSAPNQNKYLKKVVFGHVEPIKLMPVMSYKFARTLNQYGNFFRYPKNRKGKFGSVADSLNKRYAKINYTRQIKSPITIKGKQRITMTETGKRDRFKIVGKRNDMAIIDLKISKVVASTNTLHIKQHKQFYTYAKQNFKQNFRRVVKMMIAKEKLYAKTTKKTN